MLVRTPTTTPGKTPGRATAAAVLARLRRVALAAASVAAAVIAAGMLLGAPPINPAAPAGPIVLALAIYYGLPLVAFGIAVWHLHGVLRPHRRPTAEPSPTRAGRHG